MKRTAVRDGVCPVCTRNVRRSKVFTGTEESVAEEMAAWVPDFRHEACKEGS